MMTGQLSEKLHHFMAGQSLNATPMSLENLPGLHAKLVQHPCNLRFETGARLDSQILNGPHVTFLGAHSYINSGGYTRGAVFIGRFCSIGRRVTIGAGAHSIAGLSSSPLVKGCVAPPYGNNEAKEIGVLQPKPHKPTVIMNDVWIGDGAVILPGVVVGTGAVVGANCVVTKDVPPYAIVAGTPAQTLRYRFSKPWCEALLKSNWWDFPIEMINQLPTSNILKFLEVVSTVSISSVSYQTLMLES